MNVLFLINYAGKGGTEKYVKMLSHMLLDKGDYLFFAYNEKGPLAEEMKELGAKTVHFPMNSPYDIKAAKALSKICRKYQIDIIHTQFARENYIAVLSAVFYKNKAKIIHTSHINLPNSPIWKMGNRLFMNKNSGIIAVCQSVKNHLIKNKYPKEKIHVIHNGIKYQDFQGKSNKIREEFNIEGFLFSTLTRFSPEKGTQFLLESAMILKGITDKKFTVLFAGDGELLSEAKEFIKENHMEDYIILAGFRKDGEEILKSSNCFINSSQTEASSFAVFEAMGQALPIIATNVGGNPDIINNKTNCGILVEYGDRKAMALAMKELLDYPNRAEILGKNALNAVKNIFNIDISLKKTYELYKNAK